MNVEVLSIGGEKYVVGKSLAETLGITPDNFDNWFKNKKNKKQIICGIDYIDSEVGALFFFNSASRIYENANKPKKPKENMRKSRKGHELDECGLPVLPSQRRRGELINPYRI